jgi:hypothetical protein
MVQAGLPNYKEMYQELVCGSLTGFPVKKIVFLMRQKKGLIAS